MPICSPVYALLGLGASVGDRLQNLRDALRRLHEHGVQIVTVSPVYESPHLGPDTEKAKILPAHLNIVAKIATSLPPEELLQTVLLIESLGGRERNVRWGPRTIDIDILSYGTIQYQSETLTLPHPEIVNRAFVVRPLLDVVPGFRLPSGASLRSRLTAESLRSQEITRTSLSAWPSDN